MVATVRSLVRETHIRVQQPAQDLIRRTDLVPEPVLYQPPRIQPGGLIAGPAGRDGRDGVDGAPGPAGQPGPPGTIEAGVLDGGFF